MSAGDILFAMKSRNAEARQREAESMRNLGMFAVGGLKEALDLRRQREEREAQQKQLLERLNVAHQKQMELEKFRINEAERADFIKENLRGESFEKMKERYIKDYAEGEELPDTVKRIIGLPTKADEEAERLGLEQKRLMQAGALMHQETQKLANQEQQIRNRALAAQASPLAILGQGFAAGAKAISGMKREDPKAAWERGVLEGKIPADSPQFKLGMQLFGKGGPPGGEGGESEGFKFSTKVQDYVFLGGGDVRRMGQEDLSKGQEYALAERILLAAGKNAGKSVATIKERLDLSRAILEDETMMKYPVEARKAAEAFIIGQFRASGGSLKETDPELYEWARKRAGLPEEE